VIAGDHNHARVGEDLLQLVDQTGFLRSIHANSNVSIEARLGRDSTKLRRKPEHLCPWGLDRRRCSATHNETPMASRMIPVPV
jgi:hypothetical protein